MIEYRFAHCLGQDNVRKATEERINDEPPWEIHSVVFCGLTQAQPQSLAPVDPRKIPVLPSFFVIFQREVEPPPKVKGAH